MMSYETMIAAIDGNPLAAKAVLDYFDDFIDYLCTGPCVTDSGVVVYGVDMLMKTQLQGKLLHAMLKFTI